MVHHIGTQQIRTERLLLRPFSENDLEDYFVWTGSPEMTRFIMERPYRDIDEAKSALAHIIDSYSNKDYYMWGIVFQNELVGFCCGNEINEEIESICLTSARLLPALLFCVFFKDFLCYEILNNLKTFSTLPHCPCGTEKCDIFVMILKKRKN